jgi:hypothetical protein
VKRRLALLTHAFLPGGKSADCFKKITVFVILLFIAYSPLRCQKEQDSPQPRTRNVRLPLPDSFADGSQRSNGGAVG